jgi:hypothetical protein
MLARSAASAVYAQSSNTLEEIVVTTAQKRAEDVQQVEVEPMKLHDTVLTRT